MAGDQSLEQTEIALVLHLRTAVQRLWGFETELTRYRYDHEIERIRCWFEHDDDSTLQVKPPRMFFSIPVFVEMWNHDAGYIPSLLYRRYAFSPPQFVVQLSTNEVLPSV